MMPTSTTSYGSLSDFEATHSLEQVKKLANEKGLLTHGTKHEIAVRLFKLAGVLPPKPPLKPEQEAVYHVSDAVRKATGFDWSQVKGIFVGGCVERGVGSSFRAKAHAHCFLQDPYFGWICVRSAKRLGEVQGHEITKPSALLWHEYAHILTPNHYHDDAWRATMKVLGQPVPEQYKKKKRVRIVYQFCCQSCGHRWEGPYTEKCPKCGSGALAMNPKER